MSTYDGAYSDGRMKTIYSEQKKETAELSEKERAEYEERYQSAKEFDFAGHLS